VTAVEENLRDVMIGTTPVGWMLDLEYVYVICIACVFAIVQEKFDRLRTSLFLFDTIGLGFYFNGLEKVLMLVYIL
jgi:uncharacterized membrane protein YeiH